ncbi:peptidyl-tRNA hydrolase, partial [Striga asiatica]
FSYTSITISRWIGQEGVEDCIREAWNSKKRSKGLYNFQKKLRNTKMGLLGWLVPSASVQNIHKGHLMCKAIINGKEHVVVSVTGQKGNHQWEYSLLQIREWLLMGERVGWQQVEIQVGCEILRQHLIKKLAFDCNIDVLASDIFALIPSF